MNKTYDEIFSRLLLYIRSKRKYQDPFKIYFFKEDSQDSQYTIEGVYGLNGIIDDISKEELEAKIQLTLHAQEMYDMLSYVRLLVRDDIRKEIEDFLREINPNFGENPFKKNTEA